MIVVMPYSWVISWIRLSITIEVWGVEARVGFVAEEVFGIQYDGPGDSRTLDHTARQFCGVEVIGSVEPHALEAEIDPFHLLLFALLGEEVERKLDVLLDGRGVEQRTALEEHADIAADRLSLLESEGREVDVVVPDTAGIDFVQAHQTFEQHRLARAALADHQVGRAGVEFDADVVENDASVEGFRDMVCLDQISRIWVRIKLKIMMTIELATTALVEAAPTSSELPLA